MTIFNQQNNKAYAAFKEQERKSRDPDDYDSDDAMYDDNCGNQFVDPIILGVKSSFHILYILSQYTFFDAASCCIHNALANPNNLRDHRLLCDLWL